jgi:hypothetical protein
MNGEELHCEFNWKLKEGILNAWLCRECKLGPCTKESIFKPTECEIDVVQRELDEEIKQKKIRRALMSLL